MRYKLANRRIHGGVLVGAAVRAVRLQDLEATIHSRARLQAQIKALTAHSNAPRFHGQATEAAVATLTSDL